MKQQLQEQITEQIISSYDGMSESELRELKIWLFSENVRIEQERKKLQDMEKRFLNEKVQFQEEMKILNQKISMSQQRLKQDELFFSKKMDILRGGFEQLEADRRVLQRERAQLESEKQVFSVGNDGESTVSALFVGVKDALTLKKRYRDLLKIFHPDNLSGDKEMVQRITLEYEELRDYFADGLNE